MKKYEVPAMKVYELKPCRILSGSRGTAKTENYQVDDSFNSENYFDN